MQGLCVRLSVGLSVCLSQAGVQRLNKSSLN